MTKKLNRSNIILLAVLALQIVLIVLVFLPKSSTSIAESKSLFEGVKAEDIVRVSLREPQGVEMVLLKKDEQWVMPNADDFPLIAGNVSELTTKLAGLKASRVVAQTETSLKQLQVADDDYVRLIEFETADGATHQFYMGSAPSWSAAHVRLQGQQEVYLVSGLSVSDVDTSPTAWINTKILSTPADQISAITLQNKNGLFELQRGDDGQWTMKDLPASEPLDQSKVSTLIGRAGNVYIQRPLGKTAKAEYGLDAPAATVTVQSTDAEGKSNTYTIQVGAQSADGASYVLFCSASPYYALVADYSVEEMLTWTQKDFLILPEPTPADQGASQAR